MIACVAGVRKGRGRELGRETRARIPLFPSPGPLTPATQATGLIFGILRYFASQAYPRSYYFYFDLNI